MSDISPIIVLAIVLFSVIIHEVAHGYTALWQGDVTAKYEGRLTLNPLVHLDIFGSIIFPMMLYLFNLPVFGWAKPVRVNPYNFRNTRWGEAMVSFAGPLSNIIIALFFTVLIQLGKNTIPYSALEAMAIIVLINIVLAFFNLIPIPPLDGSKILFSLLPQRFNYILRTLEQYSLLFVILFIFFGWPYVTNVVLSIFEFLIG